jgi:V/A-type H+-transporting ATPase subunit I
MVDPTIFVGITFLLMFGMMFGDVGHGLVLLAGGVALAAKSRRFGDAGKLVAYCGIASVLFGILYGSLFGLEGVLPPVWVTPLEGVTDLFKAAIGFGVVVVSLGIVLNIVNGVKTHSFPEGFFDQSGPLVGIAYWAGVGIAIKFMTSSDRASYPMIFLGFFLIPLVLLFMKGPILRLLGRSKEVFPEGVTTYVMSGIIEIMEILIGYLANTMSFIRVAAFGLAHAGLFVAVFSLAEVVATKPGGMVLSWLVLIGGNALIILLEGLVVTIQALRLEYYEFFGKFFKGDGVKYDPVALPGAF